MNESSVFGRDVALEEMLAARDARAAAQQAWLARHGKPLISLTMNIAGPRKASPLIRDGFVEAVRLVSEQLARHGVSVCDCRRTERHTGYEALWAVASASDLLKRLLCAVEDADDFGRLLDIDVIAANGAKVSRADIGLPPRKCLLCDREAMLCARSRSHSLAALTRETERILRARLDGSFAHHAAGLAVRALLQEVAITPKPGLVDRTNTGAHADMDFFTFIDSAASLWPYFAACVEKGLRADDPQKLFAALRYTGMCAETDMLAATRGVNTHKGAIFSLGILCAAAGFLRGQGFAPIDAASLCETSAQMTQKTLQREIAALDGPAGARGEVMRGFPSVRAHSLPGYRRALAGGMVSNDAGVYALLSLMAVVEDANIARRHSRGRAQALMAESRAVMERFSLGAVRAMDARLIAENLSPGGCADLLAVTLFLHAMEKPDKRGITFDSD